MIGKDPYWSERISDEEFERETTRLREERGYNLTSKELLVNFQVWEQCLDVDGGGQTDKKRLPIGQGCVNCCFEIGDKLFCHMCGAWPAQRGKTLADLS